MDQQHDDEVWLVGPHLPTQHVQVLAHGRAVHAEAEHLGADAGGVELALDDLGEALGDIDEAAVHVGVADHGDAQHAGRLGVAVGGLGRVPALLVDGDEGLAAVAVAEDGVRVGHVAHDAVDRDIGEQVIGLEDQPEHHELQEEQADEHRARHQGEVRGDVCQSGAHVSCPAPDLCWARTAPQGVCQPLSRRTRRGS